MNVLFIHENTLGHGSYLPQFVNYFSAHPDIGIRPQLLLATPLPPELARKADKTLPLLRRFGLDMHFTRWRKIVSAHVLNQVRALQPGSYDAIVINTQSIALDLLEIDVPIFVSLDATFRQLSESRWFSDPPLPNVAPRLVSALIKRERELFNRATGVLPWSQVAANSLQKDYAIPTEKTHILPPSLDLPVPRKPSRHATPRALFVGADFKRKGGELLLQAFRSFQGQLELDILTQSSVSPEPGVRLWRHIEAHTQQWESLWREADFFIFPSHLETFGIVLVEAMAFELPIISSCAGAAEEILDHGKCGYLLDALTIDELSLTVDRLLGDQSEARQLARAGRARVVEKYEIAKNSARLAELLLRAR